MIASRVHFPEFFSTATLARVGRLSLVVLCLAAIAAAAVALRHGLYEHFHCNGRTLNLLWDAIRR